MFKKKHRIRREKKTVEAMVHIYCRGRHESHQGLCYKCKELLNYAEVRNLCQLQSPLLQAGDKRKNQGCDAIRRSPDGIS